MPNPVEVILTNVGIPPEDVAKIISIPEEQQDNFDTKPFVEKVRSNYTKQLQNDPAFFNDITLEKLPAEVLKKIESAQFQRSANIMKGKLNKVFGLTDADLADLTDEEKEKLESYVTAVANKFAKTKASDKQIQQELIEERKKRESLEGAEERYRTQFQKEADDKINSAIFNAALLGELSSIPGLKIAASDIAKTASDILKGKFAFERVGDYTIELRRKDNPAMKVLKDNSSHDLTLKDAVLQIAIDRGWVEEKDEDETGGKGSGKVKVTPSGGRLKMVAPHLQDKISKKIAAEQ